MMTSITALAVCLLSAAPTGTSETMSTLRVTTDASSSAVTSSTVQLEVWFGGKSYECLIAPTATSTSYECSTFEIADSGISNTRTAPLKVVNGHADAAGFSSLSITTSSGTFYSISDICIDSTALLGSFYYNWVSQDALGSCASGTVQYTGLWVDAEVPSSSGSAWPPTQYVYFDLSRPNEVIDDAVWSTSLQYTSNPTPSPTALPTANPTLQPTTEAPSAVPTERPLYSLSDADWNCVDFCGEYQCLFFNWVLPSLRIPLYFRRILFPLNSCTKRVPYN